MRKPGRPRAATPPCSPAVMQCVYGCYSHLQDNPAFHRRCYWLLDRPNIVLVHYLETVPAAVVRSPSAAAASSASASPSLGERRHAGIPPPLAGTPVFAPPTALMEDDMHDFWGLPHASLDVGDSLWHDSWTTGPVSPTACAPVLLAVEMCPVWGPAYRDARFPPVRTRLSGAS